MEFCGKIIGSGTGMKRVAYRLGMALAMTFVIIAGCSLPGIESHEIDIGQNTYAGAARIREYKGEKRITADERLSGTMAGCMLRIGTSGIMPNLKADGNVLCPAIENNGAIVPETLDVPEPLNVLAVRNVTEVSDVIVPDIPGASEIPAVPDVPAAPNSPAVSDVPETSDIPLVPGIPQAPDTPKYEAVPSPPLEAAAPDSPSEDSGGTENAVPGFRADEAGMIYKFVPGELDVIDGLLKLPGKGCSGILKGAFDGVGAGISDVEIPPDITYIENGALSGLTELYGIWTDEGNPNYTSPDGVLLDKSKSAILSFPSARIGAYEVPGYVTRIADFSFANTNLSKLSIRGCENMAIGNAIFGAGGGAGITVYAPRDLLAEYQNMFAGYYAAVE